jgi:hypothetical protein
MLDPRKERIKVLNIINDFLDFDVTTMGVIQIPKLDRVKNPIEQWK